MAACLVLLPAAAQARTLVDVFGRGVEVPDKVERLLALGSSMCFVTYLRAQELAVGVEDMDKRTSTKPYIVVNRERVRNLPVVGKAGAVRIPNYEEIIRLRPDVIFIVSTERSEPDLIQRKTGIPVVAVGYGITNFDEAVFLRSIALVGEALQRREQAEQLTAFVRSLHGALPHRPEGETTVSAYVGGLSYKGNQGIVSTSADFFPMRLAGLRNVVDTPGAPGHLFVNREYLLGANPPLMFLDGNGLPLIQDGLNADPGYYGRFQALCSGNAFSLLPNTSYFMNPEMMYVNAFFLAKIAYPEAYPDLDPVAWADKIFTAFNGEPLYGYYAAQGCGVSRLTLEQGRLVRTPYPDSAQP
ncbi:MAG: ABC transporter substrate-binding protein [Desulfovibrio sp.]